jgi:WD40 repeat protein
MAALFASAQVAAQLPGDSQPRFSHDGSAIAFWSSRDGGTVRVIAPDGSGERVLFPLPAHAPLAFSHDWRWVAFADHLRDQLVVMRPEGPERRVVGRADGVRDLAFSPDGRLLAFGTSTAGVYVIGVDGTGLRRVAERGNMPRWSPDGGSIAYVDAVDVYVVPSSGGAPRRLHRGFPETGLAPLDLDWAPNGQFLAVAFDGSPMFVPLDGGPAWWIPPEAAGPGLLAWEPAGTTIAWGGEDFLIRLDPGTSHYVRFPTEAVDPQWSPARDSITFAARGECKQDYGIYRIGADGTGLTRLTNNCRVRGTARRDVLRGTPRVDVLLGEAGDDRLTAVDQPQAGDDLFGGSGRDRLVGAAWDNRLEGGAGNDVLRGGGGGDTLVGGLGRDVLTGGGGDDAALEADGNADRVTCGAGKVDVASVDRLDSVARDCELVFRMRAVPPARVIALRVLFWPQGWAGPIRRYTLTCEPPRGTHPSARAVCTDLATRLNPFRAVGPGLSGPCRPRDARHEPELAQVDGIYLGRPMHTTLHQSDTCELQRWHRVGRLISALPSGP